MQALNSWLSLPFPPHLSLAILMVALACSAVAILFAHKRLNQSLICVSSLAAIVFVFLGGHIISHQLAATIASNQAILDNLAYGFLALVPIFTVMSVVRKPPSDGGVPPMG